MASAHDCRQMVRDDDRRLILHQSVERLLRFGDELVCIGQFRGGAFSHPAATRDAAAPRTSSLVPLNKASDEDGLRGSRGSQNMTITVTTALPRIQAAPFNPSAIVAFSPYPAHRNRMAFASVAPEIG
jgi:hypothetical protein